MVFLRKLSLFTLAFGSITTVVHLFNVIQKIFSPTASKKEDRDCILDERLKRRDDKVITILYERFFIYKTVKS